jgi:hypothetical protein
MSEREDPVPFAPPRAKGVERGKQKGAQRHGEGQHGPKARSHLLEQFRSGETKEAAGDDHDHDAEGKHRLFQGREQRDHAEQRSEKGRLDRDVREHDHNRENFQVRGGSASARATPRNPIHPGEPDAATPGVPQAAPPQRVPGVGAS